MKVWFIGQVNPRSRHTLATDYNSLHPPMRVPQPNSLDSPVAVAHMGGGTVGAGSTNCYYPPPAQGYGTQYDNSYDQSNPGASSSGYFPGSSATRSTSTSNIPSAQGYDTQYDYSQAQSNSGTSFAGHFPQGGHIGSVNHGTDTYHGNVDGNFPYVSTLGPYTLNEPGAYHEQD